MASKIAPKDLLQHLAMLHAMGRLGTPGGAMGAPGAPDPSQGQIGAPAAGGPPGAPPGAPGMQPPPAQPNFDPTGGLPPDTGSQSLGDAQAQSNMMAEHLQRRALGGLVQPGQPPDAGAPSAGPLHPEVIAALHHAVLLHALHSQHG